MFHFALTRTLLSQADTARDARKWNEASRFYKAALDRKPTLCGAWVQYGHALKETGQLPDALSAYRKAEAIDPERADTHRQLGHVLKLLGRLDEALTSYKRAFALDASMVDALREARTLALRLTPATEGKPNRLRFVNIGTTGTCNASCVHCPTGKATTAHVPRSVMPMALFKKIIDSIAELDLVVTDQIAFGLFGDGLVDPLVVERAAYLRSRLPDVRLSVNTNGAAFNLQKHAALRETASVVALHCESLTPETYNYLMAPLRAERVFPKYEQMLETFAGRIYVSVPASKRNINELPAIRRWFLDRGATHVHFDPLSSRCAEDRTVFDSLALNPAPIRCSPEIVDDLVVDCDGQILTCCQDFQRLAPIGNLNDSTLLEVLQSLKRKRVAKLFAAGRHAVLVTCSRCYGDEHGGRLMLETA